MNRRNFPKLRALFALLIFSLFSVGTVWAQNAPTVTTNDATGITAITAKGNGNVTIPNDNVVVTERGICWRTGNNNPTIDDAHLAIGAGPGYISGEMTNLTPSTQYSVRAYAKYRVNNGNEQTAYADRKTFNSLAFEQPAVTSIDVIHIRNNSAVGVAQVTDQGNDPTIERGVCWSTTPNPTIAGSHASSGMGEGNYSVEMTGLQANTTYYMRAYATNHYNTSTTVYGEEKYFHTHVHMQNGTIDVGDGGFVFTDSDADVIYPGFWYNNYEDYSVVFVPENSANGVKIVFDSLLINNDMLYFYDGDIAPENLIGVYTCNEYHAYKHSDNEQVSVFGLGGNLFTVTSHSYMTVRFVSDYHWRDFGWRAHVTQATFAPQPPAVAKMACTDDTFVLLGTSKGKKSTTLKYSVGYGGTDPGAPTEIYEGTPFIINGAYPVKIKVMTEVVETAGGEVIPSAVKMYTFGDESKVIHPDAPTITGPAEGTSTLTLSVERPAALNDTWTILYTLDGTDPASSETAQAITSTTEDPTTYNVTTSGTVALPDFCLVKAVVQGTTCPNAFSAVSEFLFDDDDNTLYLLPPTITFDGNGSTANTIITPPNPGCDIHYKVNDGPEQTYTGPFMVNPNDRVEAWVTKPGAYVPSPSAYATYLPGIDNPGSGTGVYGRVVYLDDREPHSLSYYGDETQPVHSLNPKDVKITYFGDGTGNMTNASENGDNPTTFSANATGTMVNIDAPENQFVYYKTLEGGSYQIETIGQWWNPITYTYLVPDYEGTSGKYPYTTIPNPFQVRPVFNQREGDRGQGGNNRDVDTETFEGCEVNSIPSGWDNNIVPPEGQGHTLTTPYPSVSEGFYANNFYFNMNDNRFMLLRAQNVNSQYGNAYIVLPEYTNVNSIQFNYRMSRTGNNDNCLRVSCYHDGNYDNSSNIEIRLNSNSTDIIFMQIKSADYPAFFEAVNNGGRIAFRLFNYSTNMYYAGIDNVTINYEGNTPPSNPIFNYSNGHMFEGTSADITVSDETPNVTIYYTLDGSEPDPTNAGGDNPTQIVANGGTVTVDIDHPTLKAVAVRNNNTDLVSAVTTATYSFNLSTPRFDPDGGVIRGTGSQVVTITNPDAGTTTVYYTLDGSIPTINSPHFDGASFNVTVDTENAVLRAIAIHNEDHDHTSALKTAIYVFKPNNPVITPDGGLCFNSFDVSITLEGEGTIYYTTDGSVPDPEHAGPGYPTQVYDGTLIQVSSTTTVRAIAHAEFGDSDVVDAVYVFGQNVTNNNQYRGFYKWRIERISGGKIYAADGETEKKAYGTQGATFDEYTVNAEERLIFVPDSEYGMEVDYVALWAQAYVTTRNNVSDLDDGVSYERNFVVGATQINALNRPATYSSYFPNGAQSDNVSSNVTLNPTNGNGNNPGDRRFHLAADSKFENMNFSYNQRIIGNSHYLCFGRGIDTGDIPYSLEGVYAQNGAGPLNYTLRIESGKFQKVAFIHDTYSYPNYGVAISGRYLVKGIMGSDYDRAKKDNSKLRVCCNYTNDSIDMNRLFFGYGLNCQDVINKDKETFNLVVKSGTYQEPYWNNGGNGRYDQSFYVGQNSSSGYPGARFITVEGGEFGSMNGGRGSSNYATSFSDPNVDASTIRIKGGTFHGSVFGGAADNQSTGSRRIVITGLQDQNQQPTTLIEGWVAGGCNGTGTGDDNSDGSINGNSYVYVGGYATIGGDNPITVNETQGGQVFGAGRGLYGRRSCLNNSYVVIADSSFVSKNVYGGGFHGYITEQTNVYIIGGVVGEDVYGGAFEHDTIYHYINNVPYNGYIIPATRVYVRAGEVRGCVYGGSNNVGFIGDNNAEIEMTGGTVGTLGSYDNGNVFGGGNGLTTRVLSNTIVTINGGLVVNNVYGGGNEGKVEGKATVNIVKKNDEDLGSQIGDVHSDVIPTKGNVYGGGKGKKTKGTKTYVNETEVNIVGSYIMGSVFGGGENGLVKTNTVVNVNGGQVGGYFSEMSGGEHLDCNNPYHGSVYGGGSGLNYENGQMVEGSIDDGWVRGNATVNIVSGAHVMRNVYGGSNVASVGLFEGLDHGYPNAVPNTGLATVNISGGIIGTDGHNKPLYDDNGQLVDVVSNGMVFGSSHGKAVIGKKDYAHVNETHVIIAAGADIRGSVFGGGDDGFVLGNTLVEIIDGTIGNSLTGAESEVDQYGAGQIIYTGNVYGGGRGIDLENGQISTNAGFVKGNTEVRMTGGLVRHNVYGGGSLANIGFEDSKATTGRATVHISGGQVGSTGLNNGRVFGSGRGMPADPNDPELSKYADLSNANITFVTIDGVAKVMGSVFGGGENGHVLSKTFVTIDDQATIGSDYMHPHTGNVYGGGRGVDRYDSGSGLMFSRTAGKVFESTDVRVKNGLVYHHVYGGGDMASVGLHDEIDQNDFPTFANDDEEKAFGRATVEVSGGVIGIDGNNNGHVFGSSHGWAGAAFKDLAYTRYTDVTINGDVENPTLVHGSVFGSGEDGHVLKDTHVTIEAGCTIGTNGHTGYEGNVFGGGRGTDLDETGHLSPTAGKTFGNTVVDVTGGWVKGSVFGGGRVASVGLEDEEPDNQGLYHTGHTLVTISGGEIGTLTTDHPDETVGGNVYGGGKGFAGAPYKNFTYTKNTEVHIKDNAKIHGSVFGAGEDGHTRQTTHVYIEGGTIGDRESECTNRYHGNVYGGGRGIDRDEEGKFSWTAGRANWSTEVNVSGGRVFRNVYGGGNIASVGMVLIDPDADTVMLRPNGISTRAPYDVVPIDKFGQPRYTYTKDSDGNITWAAEPNPLYGIDPTTEEYSDDNLTGWARVNITGGVIGSIEDQDHEHGNVFGSCHGKAGLEYQHLSYVTNTDVHVDYGQVDENNIIQGSVFGGGEDGHVIMNTKVTVNAGKIGNMENDDLKGNVYGGGRGVDEDENHEMSPSAGLVKGHTRVYINGGYISNSVFAGANMSAVWQEKVVNINGGEVKGSVYGGSKNVPLNRLRRGLKTVNVRNGHIYGNVYGCSQASRDGSDEAHPTLGNFSWTAFVNISGGLIDGNVHGAGYHSLVNGSTSIHIGKNAILYAKNNRENLYYNDRGGEEPDPVVTVVNGITNVEPKVDNPLIIHGSVYGGSDYYGSTNSNDWSHYDVNGITNMIIDGKGYNTTVSGESTPKYMSIDGGLYGCSTHCESGTLGRHIALRNYGTRNVDATDLGNEMTSATRTLTTIQRCNDLIIDNANVNLSGLSDITGVAHRNYAVLKVDDTLYMTNASALNLGTQTSPAYMDSIFAVRSLHLMNNDSIYADYLYKVAHRDWEWIGVAPLNPTQGYITDTANFNTKENARLYYRTSAPTNDLSYDEENVILFNGDSRLWVRYHKMVDGVNKQLYGELQGFFRMKSPFLPHGTESFAFARPKTTPNNNNLPQIQGQELYINLSDGGFLSYEIWKNFFTQKGNYGGWIYPIAGNDGGTEYTRTKQYPYTNVLKHSRGVDVEEYREWIIPMFTGKRWYVDGRGIGKGGWGIDKSHQYGWGHFPDMPKETVSGGAIAGDTLHMGGICYDLEEWTSGFDVFHPEEDIIYVVGPISADKENNTTTANNEVGPTEMNRWPEQYTLRLYRYPGGHVMSNGQIDNTVSTDPHRPVPDNTQYTGFGYSPSLPDTHNGPGANDTTMLIVEKDKSIILDNVYMDGLYGYDNLEVTYHMIPETTFPGELGLVTEPLVTTYPNSTLTMRGNQPEDEVMITKYGTVLRRGLNNLEAYDWYTNPDYNDTIHHGGGIYVNEAARVEIEELVTVDDNLQTLNYPNEDEELISCNVYLPTFTKHVWMTNELTDGTDIGITSPIRNAAWHYVHNTFSPVAVADKAGATDAVNDGIALLAYNNNNFFDDLEWFFVNNHRADNPKTTYYSTSIEDYEYNPTSTDNDVKEHFKPSNTLFFGWTWNNVVRREPTTGYLNTTTDNFAFDNINSPEDLAWLISLVNGLNRQEANTLSGVGMIKQTADVDMKQYVWLPVGAMKSGCLQFGGKYDGQGHLINHLDIAYIGLGDRRYDRVNYGLFGGINQGMLNRTFVTSGFMKPVGATIIGGLSGTLVGLNSIISNSEASVDIHCFDNTNSVSGGLVGVLHSGEIHSSMAMPVLNAVEQGTLGGLVGKVEQNEFAKTVKNSFANAKFFVGDKDANKTFRGIAGGLIGNNYANVTNCYSHLVEYDGLGASFGSLIGESSGGSVTKCYASKQTYTTGEGSSQASYEFPLSHYVAPGEDPFVTNCYRYTPVKGADYFGYMYYDNVVEFGETESDVIPLFDTLNGWVDRNNADSKYAYWSRPTIPEINGDMPVLMLCDADGELPHQGSFRSLATYNGGHSQTGAFADNDTDYPGVVLQYGGPIRDGENNELDAALDREKVHTDMDYLFIYGDVINTIAADQIAATKGKVSVYEHAAINSPGTLAEFGNTYVGVTFDNSCGHAYSTPGINHLGNFILPRDWHMFSTPLSNAPLGFNYEVNGVNTNLSQYYPENPTGAAVDNGDYYNNPWPYLHQQGPYGEFTWLNNAQSNDKIRYWMKGWENSQSLNVENPGDYQNEWADGYFPSRVDGASEFSNSCIETEDEYGRFPYGMDMFCWYEPEPHWINFKRNGPNHWHSDEYDGEQHLHAHLAYTENGISNQNEDDLVVGKGYMFSIAKNTYLQSHGLLNSKVKNRDVTSTMYINYSAEDYSLNGFRGWNLVGNPYHAYLDFEQFASPTTGNPLGSYYVIYDADGFKGSPTSAYLYYPIGGSSGGEYADQYLHPHQGFFVYSNGGTLTFNERMTVARDEATSAYRGWKPNYPLVNLYLNSEKGCSDVTVIEFNRPEWGGAMKQKALRNGNGSIYAYNDGVPYAALFAQDGVERVPVWFEADEDDVFTLTWKTANGDFNSLYLIDNLTGVRYDMLENDEYVFEGKVADYHSRFYITFNCFDVEENEDTETNIAFFDGSQWVVTGEGNIELIDLQGRVLWNSRLSGGQSRVSVPNVAAGLYLFRLTNANETKVQKIIIK